MRITRSTLRRLIAEESTRLLREAAFPEEVEAVYGEEPPEDGGGDGIPKMLHVMYRGFRPVFIVTDVDANPLGEEAEDVTQQIQPAKSNMTTPEIAQAIIDFITDESNGIMYVFDEEMNDSETDEKFETEDYVEHLEGLISSGEEEAGSRGGEMHKRAVERGEDEDLFEGDDLDDLDETEDQHYNDDLQSRLGRFTSPENVKGTPQHKEKHAPPTGGTRGGSGYVSRRSEWGDEDLFGGPPRVDEGGPGDDFLDYDPEEIPDMDDQYDPDYYEGLDDEGDDEDFVDYETGEDDVPYGAADVALRMGRGHRTDESLNESIDMLSAGIGAIVGIAALYAAGPLSSAAKSILDELSFKQQQSAKAAARKEEGSKLAAAIENLSHDKALLALFKELEELQKSDDYGVSVKIGKKSKEITAYIRDKRKEMSFGTGDEQDVRRGVVRRMKKGDDDKGGGDEKLDEARWATLAGILKG